MAPERKDSDSHHEVLAQEKSKYRTSVVKRTEDSSSITKQKSTDKLSTNVIFLGLSPDQLAKRRGKDGWVLVTKD